MNSQMCSQSTCIWRCKVTQVALVWPLPWIPEEDDDHDDHEEDDDDNDEGEHYEGEDDDDKDNEKNDEEKNDELLHWMHFLFLKIFIDFEEENLLKECLMVRSEI